MGIATILVLVRMGYLGLDNLVILRPRNKSERSILDLRRKVLLVCCDPFFLVWTSQRLRRRLGDFLITRSTEAKRFRKESIRLAARTGCRDCVTNRLDPEPHAL